MFLGVKDKLTKKDFDAKEIYTIPDKYKNNFYFQEGLLFDEEVETDIKTLLSKKCSNLNWYKVKALPVPFEAAVRYKEDFPDLYEAAVQMSQWFCRYVKQIQNKSNEVFVVNLWVSDKKQNVKITEKILKIAEIDLYNYEMPRDIIFRLE